MDSSFLKKEKEHATSIHLNSNEKVNEIVKETGITEIKFGDLNCIRNITHHFMKIAKKSNENYFNWMYSIGCHIKEKYNGGWVLIHYQGVDFKRHSCTVVNNKDDIWQVGNFCYTIYFNKYRM